MTEFFWALLLAAIPITWWIVMTRRMRDQVERMEHRFRGYGRREE